MYSRQLLRPRAGHPGNSWAVALGLTLALVGACGDEVDLGPDASADPVFLDDPSGELPLTLSEVGIYPQLPSIDVVDGRALAYEPAWPLWTNGSAKHRYLVLPEGAVVDNSVTPWEFPEGTLFFKTFAFWDADGVERPAETRVMRRAGGGWEFGTYVFDADGLDATLSDMRLPVPVDVLGDDGEAFQHLVPNGIQCRRCHESSPGGVLGFTEVQLAEPIAGAGSAAHALYDAGAFGQAPREEPDRVAHDDDLTREVLGYITGNCTHCHNGSGLGNASYDLRHGVALANLVDQPTASSMSAEGIRVIPGNAEESILFEAFSRETDETDIEFMPPLGVERVDAQAVETIRRWIQSLPTTEE